MVITTNSYDIANTVNNYFASIAETLKKRIKYSHKLFSDYLANKNGNKTFLWPTDKDEIANISSLNSSKASDQNSVPYRILYLLKNEIPKQLADLFEGYLRYKTIFCHEVALDVQLMNFFIWKKN